MANETFLRFTVAERHHKSETSKGLFSAIWDLDDEGTLTSHESAWWAEVVGWFGRNLPDPRRTTASVALRTYPRAVYWFRASALEHISRMYEAKALLESHGVPVEVSKTNKPGYLVYEDEFQVAAEPFRGDAH